MEENRFISYIEILAKESLHFGVDQVIEFDDIHAYARRVEFLKESKVIKSCLVQDLFDLKLTIKGYRHKWISDADGSSERFRKFLAD